MKRTRASDRVIQALRDQMLHMGWVECVRDRGRIHVATARYGPGHQRIRLVIRPGNGRPRAGEIGLIAALAGKTGYSRHIIQRALAGMPRAGAARRLPEEDLAQSQIRPTEGAPAVQPEGRGLAAIGLSDVSERQRRAPLLQGPEEIRETIRQAVLEALDAALSAGVVPDEALSAVEAVQLSMSAGARPVRAASPVADGFG